MTPPSLIKTLVPCGVLLPAIVGACIDAPQMQTVPATSPGDAEESEAAAHGSDAAGPAAVADEPPAADADDECVPGAQACDGNTPATCNSRGTWVEGDACPVLCARGECADSCTPGDQQCSGKVPQICSADRDWSEGSACEWVCAAGECTAECAPNGTRCNGATREICQANGEWGLGSECPVDCALGECVGEPSTGGSGGSSASSGSGGGGAGGTSAGASTGSSGRGGSGGDGAAGASTAGTGAAAGTSGVSGSGGSGGMGCPEADDCTGSNLFELSYGTGASDPEGWPDVSLELENLGSPVSLAQLSFRYYFDAEHDPSLAASWSVRITILDLRNPYHLYDEYGAEGRVVELAPPVNGQDSYVEVTLNVTDTLEQGRILGLAFYVLPPDFEVSPDQSNDWSFGGNYVGVWNRIPVYVGGVLAYGEEP